MGLDHQRGSVTTALWGEKDWGGGDGSMRPETKADAAYRELRRRIVDGSLEPGSRLDQEMLAAALGVSTTPLREALRRLEAERLVQRAAHRQVVSEVERLTQLARGRPGVVGIFRQMFVPFVTTFPPTARAMKNLVTGLDHDVNVA